MLTADSLELFPLSARVTYLNHGGFGVTPRTVLDEKKRILDRIEENPAGFLSRRIKLHWQQVADMVAQRFAVNPGSLALVENATDGVEAVIRALPLAKGDEILVTSMCYGAVAMAARHIASSRGAKVITAELPFPPRDVQQYVMTVAEAITPHTKLAILDHITSATALLMPVEEMIAVCRERGVSVLIDGAHAPGQTALNIAALNADWYVGNLHKWYFVPRGCGFLWAAPGKEVGLMPNVISWEINRPFPSNFAWTGTRDPANWLAVPAAFAFMDRFGENTVRKHNHQLILDAVAMLANMWGFRPTIPAAMTAAMSLVPAPEALPYPPTDEGRARLEVDLEDKYSVIVNASYVSGGRIWLRIAAQIYNRIEDYQRLGECVLALCQAQARR